MNSLRRMSSLVTRTARTCLRTNTKGRHAHGTMAHSPLRRHLSQAPSSSPAYMHPLPEEVTIVEVGCRDGLQNESADYIVPTETKCTLLAKLSHTGLRSLESVAFVHPKWVPQMATSVAVYEYVKRHLKEQHRGIVYSALVPNLKGLEQAIALGVTEVMMITAASEAFSQKNSNCSIAESLARCKEVIAMAHKHGIRVRTAVSCAFGCPYEGPIPIAHVCDVVEQLDGMGCDEIVIADTIGIGTPGLTYQLLTQLRQRMEVEKGRKDFLASKVAGHYHNTYGQATSNILTSLSFGISTFDCSVGGLGGCPYAKGATGNVATEDVVYMLHSLGIKTGVDLDKLIDVSDWITKQLGKTKNESKVSTAILNKAR